MTFRLLALNCRLGGPLRDPVSSPIAVHRASGTTDCVDGVGVNQFPTIHEETGIVARNKW